ncbi:MAG: hypothetical protein GY869_01410 [Planctomycetes bacterium]|nr:hypothetical protein [Planctomycetota bacterium]
MDTEQLKKPQTWAVVIPAGMTLIALYLVFNFYSLKKEAADFNKYAGNALVATKDILDIHARFGTSPLAGNTAREFIGVDSALECARNAKISSGRWKQLASTNSEKQRDGAVILGENYQLNQVNLLQVIQFLDYAEKNYAALSCTNLTLEVPSRGAMSTDNWSAQLNLKYLEKK